MRAAAGAAVVAIAVALRREWRGLFDVLHVMVELSLLFILLWLQKEAERETFSEELERVSQQRASKRERMKCICRCCVCIREE